MPHSNRISQCEIVDCEITATDGFSLAATIYQAVHGCCKVVIMLPAIGNMRSQYRDYALYLAENGWTAVTFDYRGIGESKRGRLSGSTASLRDWGEKDVAGVIDWVHDHFHPQWCAAVAHSVGAQVLGFARNHDRVDALLAIAAQKGYWKNWGCGLQWVVAGFFAVVPVLVKLWGYLPMRLAGSQDLPPNVALEWRRWGVHPDFVDEQWRPLNNRFRTFTSPILSISFSDDRYLAPRRSVEALLKIYSRAPSEHRHVTPQEFGVSKIGHSAFFIKGVCPRLWRATLEWLEGNRSFHSSLGEQGSASGKTA